MTWQIFSKLWARVGFPLSISFLRLAVAKKKEEKNRWIYTVYIGLIVKQMSVSKNQRISVLSWLFTLCVKLACLAFMILSNSRQSLTSFSRSTPCTDSIYLCENLGYKFWGGTRPLSHLKEWSWSIAAIYVQRDYVSKRKFLQEIIWI